jgi:hypothetical protein
MYTKFEVNNFDGLSEEIDLSKKKMSMLMPTKTMTEGSLP